MFRASLSYHKGVWYLYSVFLGEGSVLNQVPTQRGSTVSVISLAHASVVLASTFAIVLPPFSFGFSE
jgi:hypothetical protein